MKTLNPAVANRPKLLVSVRNPQEARLAIEGGAEIIDIKEPSRGSLGKADDGVIAEIALAVRELDQAFPISVALGELHEWEAAQNPPRLPKEIAFVKLGLAGFGNDMEWGEKWRHFRDRFQTVNPHSPGWVMVSYADWESAKAPHPEELIAAAISFGCQAVLLDTFRKDGRSLLDILPWEELLEIQAATHRRELPLAVAGSLRTADLTHVRLLSPEIVAIRSAACREGIRDGSICPIAVRQFRDSLRENQLSERFND